MPSERLPWDGVWEVVASSIALRSSCERARVGAVLVKDKRVVSTGYNGPASGHPADTSVGCSNWCDRAAGTAPTRDTGYGFTCPSIHAEANALLYASRTDAEGATMYVTHAPCAECAKLISNSGVVRVVISQEPEDHRPNPIPYLESCGIRVSVLR